MAIPQTGLSISQIKREIESSSNDVGTLCKSPTINMWAKYKPIRYNTTSGITEEQRKEANYGMSIPYANSPTSVIEYYNNNSVIPQLNGWEYLKPTGGSSSPYRLGDFRGYNKLAISPINKWVCPDKVDNVLNSSLLCTITLSQGVENSLNITDIVDWYFGCVIFNLSGGFERYSAQRKIDINSINTVNIDTKNLKDGSYYVYPFLTDTKYEYNTNTSMPTARFMALPNVARKSVSITSQPTGLQVLLTGNKVGNTANYKVVIKQNIYDLHEVDLYCVYSNWDGKRPLQIGEFKSFLGTVSANQNPTFTGSFNGLTSGRIYKLVLRMGRGQYEYETFLLEGN